MSRLRPPLNLDDLKVIFDVLNVYDPNDIQDVYPEMGEREFLDDVRIAWHKVLVNHAMFLTRTNNAKLSPRISRGVIDQVALARR